MKLLIVDDQSLVVDALVNRINWEKIGISSVFSAYSTIEAEYILQKTDIDILLCDIEMPMENGLSLVRRLRERGMETCVIMLTAHAKFPYAQEAMQYGVFDYVLQPAPYDKIAEAVSRAVIAEKKRRSRKELEDYGAEYIRHERRIVNAQALSWITGKNNRREMERLEIRKKIPARTTQMRILALQILNSKVVETWEADMLEYALYNIASEVLQPFHQEVLVLSLDVQMYSIWIWGEGRVLSEEILRRQLEFLQSMLVQHFHCDTAIYLSPVILAEQTEKNWRSVSQMAADNVSKAKGLFYLDTSSPTSVSHYRISDIEEWVTRLKGENPRSVEFQMNKILDSLIAEGQLNSSVLAGLHQDFVQAIYMATKGDMDIFEIFAKTEQLNRLYRSASSNVEDMRQFISEAINLMIQNRSTEENDLIKKIDSYIDLHMEEEIHRKDLADAIFLNADYLNRQFKQQTGYSLKEYVVNRKLEKARILLQTTRLPVQLIAAKVGYNQVNYFSTAYKKQYGYTPLQERKEGNK